eukprot:5859956-Pleurochrysis_carterae.AAC.1
MRPEDLPRRARAISAGHFAPHIFASWRDAFLGRGGMEQETIEWAAALLAHNALLRAGEIGHPQER